MAAHTDSCTEDDLERLMAEPWNPESYLSDDNEDTDINSDVDQIHTSVDGSHKLSQLFETNLSAIEHDMMIVQSNRKYPLETVGSLDDEDKLSKFMTYQDPIDHLRTLDTVNIANAKEISTDIDRFNHFKQRNSIDNDDVSMSITIEQQNDDKECDDEIDKLLQKMPTVATDDVITSTTGEDPTAAINSTIKSDENKVNGNILSFTDELTENLDPYESDELYLADEAPLPSLQQQQQSLFDVGLILPDIPESLPSNDLDETNDDLNVRAFETDNIHENSLPCDQNNDTGEVQENENPEASLNDLLASITSLDVNIPNETVETDPSVANNPSEISAMSTLDVNESCDPVPDDIESSQTQIDIVSTEELATDAVQNIEEPDSDGHEDTACMQDQTVNNDSMSRDEMSPSSDIEAAEVQSPSADSNTDSDNPTNVQGDDAFLAPDDQNRLRAISGASTVSSTALSEGSVSSMNGESGPLSIAPPPFSETALPTEGTGLGHTAPVWIPDAQVTECRMCQGRFNVVRRRHHCRACGQIFCKNCCNMRFALHHLQNKIARVCQQCYEILTRDPIPSNAGTNIDPPSRGSPPPDYEASSSNLPPRYPAPPVPLDRFGQPVYPPTQNRGITPPQTSTVPRPLPEVPGVDANISNPRPQRVPSPEYTALGRPRQSRMRTESEMSAVIMFNSSRTNLPPILKNVDGVLKIINNPDIPSLILQMQDVIESPVVFLVNKNLIVKVKITQLDCCIKQKCWSLSTDGMGASNQEEIALVLEYSETDNTLVLKRVLQQINAIFERAKQGEPVNELSYMTFDASLCLDPSMTSLLFFKRSNQCIENLLLPQSPHLFGLTIHKQEISWARNFPLRLLLRHRAESTTSPSHLVSPIKRDPYYAEIGRTIIELLADFRGFQYTLPRIPGVTIMMKSKDLTLKLPQGRHEEIVKAFSMEDNIVSLAGGYSTRFDAFLACNQVDGAYKTQILTMNGPTKKVTGACFVIFSAALKVEEGQPEAKANVVEDGIMVQVTSELMQKIRAAVNDSKDLKVPCSKRYSEEVGKLKIQWTSSDSADASRPCSPIDGTPFSSLTNMKIRHSYDYTTNSLLAKIHWMEVYFLPNDSDTLRRLSARELGQLTSSVAKACMSALSPHLSTLIALEMNKIGLRVNLDSEVVEYKIGANEQSLPGELSGDLDDKLIPAIHSVITTLPQGRVAVELVFNVVQIV